MTEHPAYHTAIVSGPYEDVVVIYCPDCEYLAAVRCGKIYHRHLGNVTVSHCYIPEYVADMIGEVVKELP